MSEDFEIFGRLPGPWQADIDAFLAVLKTHPWGGPSFERLVIVTDETFPDALRCWMTSKRYSEWVAGYAGGRIHATGAIHFTAYDGLRTAVVMPLAIREAFMFFVAHEAVEAALSARAHAGRYRERTNTNLGLAHILWIEYVVERARREITAELGWPRSKFDSQAVSHEIRTLHDELPKLLRWAVANEARPKRLHQRWFELARVYAMTLGRADAGDEEERVELQRLRTEVLGAQTSRTWDAVDGALRGVFTDPSAAPEQHDERVFERGVEALYAGLSDFWNPRYEQGVAASQRSRRVHGRRRR
jgi:hypothetical protein